MTPEQKIKVLTMALNNCVAALKDARELEIHLPLLAQFETWKNFDAMVAQQIELLNIVLKQISKAE